MAFESEDGRSNQEVRDEVFLIRVEEWAMRDLTNEEIEMAFELRDDRGCNARDAAALILALAEAEA